MIKRRSNRLWLHDHLNDPYVKLAQRDGYRTRAAYKLKEIDERDKLIRPGQTIIDLGAAPGSWSQYIRRKLVQGRQRAAGGMNGTLIALDKLPIEPIADVLTIVGDFREPAVLMQLEQAVGDSRVNLVLSDMAPNLSGIAAVDAAHMSDLCELALAFAVQYLEPNGALLVKCFQGSGYSQIVEQFKHRFKSVVARKPKASRDKSAETFLLGKSLKNAR